jgi:hypothetical protein
MSILWQLVWGVWGANTFRSCGGLRLFGFEQTHWQQGVLERLWSTILYLYVGLDAYTFVCLHLHTLSFLL